MNREYFIVDGDGNPSELELPAKVGGKNQSGIVIPGVGDDQVIAIIADADGHAYIQPHQPAHGIFHNDERLTDSAWLKSGDRVQIADSVLSWDIQGDRVLIKVQPNKLEIGELRPPKQAPSPPTSNNSLPVAGKDPLAGGTKHLRRSVIAVVSALVLITIFLLTATSVVIHVEPADATIKLKGFPPALYLGGSHLAIPGQYQLNISAPGYQTVTTELDIDMGPSLNLNYVLPEQPGTLVITTVPPVIFQLFEDDSEVPAKAKGQYELERGEHQLRMESQRYLTFSLQATIGGFGAEQNLEVILEPAWAVVSIASSPAGAEVLVDDEKAGFTPIDAEIIQGQRKIHLQKPGFKPITLFRTVKPGQDFGLEEFRLEPVDGQLSVSSNPAGASILVGDKFLGTTPQTMKLAAEAEHKLHLSKVGYHAAETTFRLAPDEERTLDIPLKPEYGTIFLNIQPAGATLTVNGKKSAKDSGRLRLQTLKNTLLVSKPGYVSETLTLTPQAGVSQNLSVSLATEQQHTQQQAEQQQEAATPRFLTTTAGQSLELITPQGSFKMGASRRDAGRRANESQRLVELKRPFYLAHKEVSNADFRRFKPLHDSGRTDAAALNGEDQPVVYISWNDAARYCNWLSQQEGLPPAYQEQNNQMLAIDPVTIGYRLPTEAEWAWVARRYDVETENRYPWQGSFPPVTKSGNYADARIADTLADVVPNYDDSYRGTAPVGSFPAWPNSSSGQASTGFYDLGGNAAEWMHDIYAVYPGEASHLVVDPLGPVSGQHHVIRGASWRHGSITELRLSFRDYSSKLRYDLGFRIARYAE